MIKLRDTGHIQTRMAVSMKDSFIWISRMAKELKCGLMVHNTTASTRTGKRMAEVYSSGQMGARITENSSTITLRDRVSTSGLMVGFTKGPGLTIRCMVSALLIGPMVGGTRARITMTRKRA